ncbi:hypothetical protein [Methylotenera sp. G11]|uniref:hypothetical protein n=1 Tax=Methylotenera sp. G11 TaxID=1506585 RepID=UPI000A813AED|nr:hypothetical protein [Methylotenera sp. G11]
MALVAGLRAACSLNGYALHTLQLNVSRQLTFRPSCIDTSLLDSVKKSCDIHQDFFIYVIWSLAGCLLFLFVVFMRKMADIQPFAYKLF